MFKKIKDAYVNNGNLIKNIIGAGGVKGAAVLISLITMPVYMGYFSDSSVLGIWFTMISVLDSMAIMDLGLGNGLRNQLAEALALKNEKRSKQLISSSYFIITFISIMLLCVGWSVVPYLNWNIVLGIEELSISNLELILCIRILLIGVIFQLPLKLITSILYAMQKAALASVLPVCTNLCMLLFVLVAPEATSAENLLLLSRAYCILANLPYFAMSLILFTHTLKHCRPNIKYASSKTAKNIMKLGVLFFYLSLMSMMTHNTNEVLISALFQSSMVVEYQAYNKMFNLIVTVMNIVMIPLWSAITKARIEKKFTWMSRLHTYLCMLSIVSLAVGLVMIPLSQPLADVWLRENVININPLLCIPFAIYVAEETFNGANATVANGSGWIKAQIFMAPVSAVLNIPFTILFRSLTGHWISIMLANICSLMPIAIVQFIYIRVKLKKSQEN